MRECRGCEILSGNSGQVYSKGLTIAEPASVFQLRFQLELAFWKVFLLFWNFQAEGIDIVAFDEAERMLFVSFFRKSLSRVLWTSHKGISRDAMQFQELGAILDCCHLAQIASISCASVFLAALNWGHPFFFCAISTIKKLLLRIERTLLIFGYY